jgi:hypothetical protein
MSKKVLPYYLVLQAINFGKKLSPKDEELLGSDPAACLLYASRVLNGRLPDYLHNKMILGVWEDSADQESVQKYLKSLEDFSGKSLSGTV